MQLYSRVRGEGDPVIVLHGLFGDADNLSKLSTALAETSEVHSLDARNHGRSEHCASMRYDEMAADVMRYLDEHDIQACSILGHSMGGKTAMQCALSYPERINKLIVADIAPVTYSPHHVQIFSGLSAVDRTDVSSRKQAYDILGEHIEDEGVKQFLLKSLFRDAERKYRWRFNFKAIVACYQQVLAGIEPRQAYEGDTLFIAGSDSDYILPDYKSEILNAFPKAKLKTIMGAGHWLHAQKPDTFNGIATRFLAD